MTFSTSLTETGRKENFFFIKYLDDHTWMVLEFF